MWLKRTPEKERQVLARYRALHLNMFQVRMFRNFIVYLVNLWVPSELVMICYLLSLFSNDQPRGFTNDMADAQWEIAVSGVGQAPPVAVEAVSLGSCFKKKTMAGMLWRMVVVHN